MSTVLRHLLTALAALSVLAVVSASAQDTVWVRTLTFDSVTTRRGVWNFPDRGQTYRKILMYHTLKCDPRTTQDKYNCGEWDYLTYALVYQHTGRMDSSLLKAPLYKIGMLAPDTISFTTTPTSSTFQRWAYSMKINQVTNETAYPIVTATNDLPTGAAPARFQFPVTKAALQAAGLTGLSTLSGIRLDVATPGSALRHFTVKVKTAGSALPVGFDNAGFTTLFSGDVPVTAAGNLNVYFTTPYQWNGSSDLLFDVSYDGASGTAPVLRAGPASGGYGAAGESTYLEFGGTNDYVDCGTFPELSGAQKATYEAWVRVDSWEGTNKIIGVGDRFHIELGGKEGEIYCFVRNPANTYGTATTGMKAKSWYHIAMVYDGTQADNAKRLKLYVNGKPVNLTYGGTIPAATAVTDASFSLTELAWGGASLDGALKEVRVWKGALDAATIAAWWSRSMDDSHPNRSDLLAYYPMSEGSGTSVPDHSGNGRNGIMLGAPAWRHAGGDELVLGPAPLVGLPGLALLKGTYVSSKDSTLVTETVQDAPMGIATYEIRDHAPAVKSVRYAWQSGWQYTYDPTGKKVDSTAVPTETKLINSQLSYYGAPFEVLNQTEIGRYITPYGINLDLGPNGFTWVYDVTEYEPLLHGQVDLSSGNQQELIDLKFAFIKGDPPRGVIQMDNLSGSPSEYSYSALSNNTVLRDTTIHLNPQADQFMVRTRLSGHGHNSNDGNYPHCCEWKDNTHYLKVADTTFSWHIFQYDDCALNPVYPQGGTWPGSREGWCPGDKVKDHDFEITRLVHGDSVSIDYDITKVPADNLGMGGGVYVTTMQLFEFTAPTHGVDAEIYDVKAPTSFPYYSRRNPICADPVVVVRNNGVAPITTLAFDYGVSGGPQQHQVWTGSIAPNEMAEITLPVPNASFWVGDGSNRFTVKSSKPNGLDDQYADNDGGSVAFKMPDLYPGKIVLTYRTNKRPADYTLEIKDLEGNVVRTMENLDPETIYRDTLDLPPGCYTLQFTDPNNLGLSYWAYPDQGSGYVRIYGTDGKLLKSFNPDAGHGYTYSFNLGTAAYVQEPGFDAVATVFPNPAAGNVRIVIDELPLGHAVIKLFDTGGSLLRTESAEIGERFAHEIDTRELPAGSYFVTIETSKGTITKRFIKR